MGKRMAIAAVASLSLLLVLYSGCGAAKTGEEKGADSTPQDDGSDGITRTDYDLGLVEGYEDGFSQGYTDGKAGAYNPEPGVDPSWDEYYATGYEEGYLEGYEKGYQEAQGGNGEGVEMEEIKEVMLDFVSSNSSPGLQFEIKDLVIHGDEAAARVVCTSEKLEDALVIVKKGPSGWYGEDFGTGIEIPSWYQP